MKILLAYIFAVLFLSACANTSKESTIIFAKYNQYKEYANKENIDKIAESYFTQALLGSNYKDNPAAKSQLLFKNYMSFIDSHYESSKSQLACLTVNGFDESKEPVIISLEYAYLNMQWLINEIHVVFIEKETDFSASAKCPDEFTK